MIIRYSSCSLLTDRVEFARMPSMLISRNTIYPFRYYRTVSLLHFPCTDMMKTPEHYMSGAAIRKNKKETRRKDYRDERRPFEKFSRIEN